MKYQPNDDKSDEAGSVYQLNINGSSTPLTVKETTLNNPISFANSVGTLIVSDSVYEQMKLHMTPETKILSINGSVIENNEDLFAEISELLNGSPYLQGNTHRVNEIVSLSSSTFLLIGGLKNKLCNRINHPKMTMLKLQPKRATLRSDSTQAVR